MRKYEGQNQEGNKTKQMKDQKLTSPGHTINWKLLNKFAISRSAIGLTPLTWSNQNNKV